MDDIRLSIPYTLNPDWTFQPEETGFLKLMLYDAIYAHLTKAGLYPGTELPSELKLYEIPLGRPWVGYYIKNLSEARRHAYILHETIRRATLTAL